MPKDPLKIIGQPNPTPEQRAQAGAVAAHTRRPALPAPRTALQSTARQLP